MKKNYKKIISGSVLIGLVRASSFDKQIPLSDKQIKILEKNGNRCRDWKRVSVSSEFCPDKIIDSEFEGDVYLGGISKALREPVGTLFGRGIKSSFIKNCAIADNVVIRNVSYLSDTVLHEGAAIVNVGVMDICGEACFGAREKLKLGNESGEHTVSVYAEIDLETITGLCASEKPAGEIESYERFLEEYSACIRCGRNIVGPFARILNTPRAQNVFLGPHSVLDGATLVKNSSLVSSREEPCVLSYGVIVEDSSLQWGSRVSTGAIVKCSVLMEHAYAESRAKVTHSVIGPCSGVRQGELVSSFIGPFVGFHHQALLIACLWPGGKGNVAYGANVGSNHTGRAADQEILCAEGNFFGLGCTVKFPCDLSAAPYLFIASGVLTQPQKIEYPFSLLRHGRHVGEKAKSLLNEIIPAWVLSDNLYALERNSLKYKERNLAVRNKLNEGFLSPSVVDMMIKARDSLTCGSIKKDIYLPGDIKGLGKNFLAEPKRAKAAEAYDFFIKYYALLWLLRKLGEDVRFEVIKLEPSNCRQAHEQVILASEFSDMDTKALLKRLSAMSEEYYQMVVSSRQKDYDRGISIISKYNETHVRLEEDNVIVLSRDQKDKMQNLCSRIIKKK